MACHVGYTDVAEVDPSMPPEVQISIALELQGVQTTNA